MQWFRAFCFLLPLVAAGCGASSAEAPKPAQVSEEERRLFREEEKRVFDLEAAQHKGGTRK